MPCWQNTRPSSRCAEWTGPQLPNIDVYILVTEVLPYFLIKGKRKFLPHSRNIAAENIVPKHHVQDVISHPDKKFSSTHAKAYTANVCHPSHKPINDNAQAAQLLSTLLRMCKGNSCESRAKVSGSSDSTSSKLVSVVSSISVFGCCTDVKELVISASSCSAVGNLVNTSNQYDNAQYTMVSILNIVNPVYLHAGSVSTHNLTN